MAWMAKIGPRIGFKGGISFCGRTGAFSPFVHSRGFAGPRSAKFGRLVKKREVAA